MRAREEGRIAQHPFRQGLHLPLRREKARLDRTLAGNGVEQLIPLPQGGVLFLIQLCRQHLQRRGHLIFGHIRRRLTDEHIPLTKRLRKISQLLQCLLIFLHRGHLPGAQAADQWGEQRLSRDGHVRPLQLIEQNTLVGSVLVDEQQLVSLLHQQIRGKALTQITNIPFRFGRDRRFRRSVSRRRVNHRRRRLSFHRRWRLIKPGTGKGAWFDIRQLLRILPLTLDPGQPMGRLRFDRRRADGRLQCSCSARAADGGGETAGGSAAGSSGLVACIWTGADWGNLTSGRLTVCSNRFLTAA